MAGNHNPRNLFRNPRADGANRFGNLADLSIDRFLGDRDRIAMILSEDDAAALIEVDHEEPGCRIHAFVSMPASKLSTSRAGPAALLCRIDSTSSPKNSIRITLSS